MQPQLDIELVASPFCFFSREREFYIYLKYRLHHSKPITVNKLGSIFDPTTTFTEGRIEIRDTATEEQDQSLVLKPGEGSYFFWTVSTQPLRWHEYSFDFSSLAPDHKYIVSYNNHGISQWYSGSHSSLEEANASSMEAQSGDLIQVYLIGEDSLSHFTTRQTVRPPPAVSATLSTSSATCSLNPTTTFTVFLTWRSQTDRAIYALIIRKEGHNIGLEIRDPEKNGRRIGPPSNIQPSDEDGGAPSNDEEKLVRFHGLEASFSQEYTLEKEERWKGLVHSDTWKLKSGKSYEITLRKMQWRWMYEDEIEEDVRQDEAKVVERLRQEPYWEWKPECRTEFQVQ